MEWEVVVRAAKHALIVALLLLFIAISLPTRGAPVTYPLEPPSWYNVSIPSNTIYVTWRDYSAPGNWSINKGNFTIDDTNTGGAPTVTYTLPDDTYCIKFKVYPDTTSTSGTGWFPEVGILNPSGYYTFLVQYNRYSVKHLYFYNGSTLVDTKLTEKQNFTITICWDSSAWNLTVELENGTTRFYGNLQYKNPGPPETFRARGGYYTTGIYTYYYLIFQFSLPYTVRENYYVLNETIHLNLDIIEWTARAPDGYAFTAATANETWLDEAHGTFNGTLTFKWDKYFKLLSNATLHYGYNSYNVTAPAYVTPLPDLINCPQNITPIYPGEELVCAPPPAGLITVYIAQYGTDYEAVGFRTADGRVIGRGRIGAAGYAIVPGDVGSGVYIYLLAPDEVRAYGYLPLTNPLTLRIMPPPPPPYPAYAVNAEYNATEGVVKATTSCPGGCTLVVETGNETVRVPCTGDCYAAVRSDTGYYRCWVEKDGQVVNATGSWGSTIPGEGWATNVTKAIGRALDFSAIGVDPATFLVYLLGLVVFIMLSVAGSWEVGLVAFGVVLAVGSVWAGIQAAGMSIAILAGATIHAVVKRLRQE